tara:strand:- start:206 stop:418 length:213 start_codon:yes stop_codon:yes gene_type:complete
MKVSQYSRFFDANIFGINSQKSTIKANIMQVNIVNSTFWASISATMQIAIIEALRSEAIKPKEEFAWLLE